MLEVCSILEVGRRGEEREESMYIQKLLTCEGRKKSYVLRVGKRRRRKGRGTSLAEGYNAGKE